MWDRFWNLVLGVSVSTKILGMILGLVILFGLGFTLQIRSYLTNTLIERLDKIRLLLADNHAVLRAGLGLPLNA